MNKTFPTIFLLVFGLFSFGSALEARATETIFVYSAVGFDSDAHEASGATATWITYGLYDYYDPAAYGELFYANPPDFIDQDGGEGVNNYLYGYYPGYYADFTTNDYRPNKILCTYGEHGLRAIYVPVPFQAYDPYQISLMNVMSYGAEGQMNMSNSPINYYSSGDYYVVAETLVCIQTPIVQSVTFQALNSAITDNPTGDFGNGAVFGGGKRIFPDRQTPTDGINRRTVQIRAQLASSGGSPTYTSGVRVYFRNFDVDDPSNDSTIDDNGTLGNDNREFRDTPQSAGSLSNCTATSNGCYAFTDSNGVAIAIFTVTKQPGDNFVIAAGTDDAYLGGVGINGTGLKDSSNQSLPTGRAKRTDLLTVWRKVHLEVDSMGTVSDNLVNGYIRSKTFVGSTPVWINVSPGIGNLEEGRFRATRRPDNSILSYGGRLTFLGSNDELQVLDNTANSIQVQSVNGSVVQLHINQIFGLYDDDDYNSDNLFFSGDNGEDVELLFDTLSYLQPSTNINSNPYAAAYIEPEYDWYQSIQSNQVKN